MPLQHALCRQILGLRQGNELLLTNELPIHSRQNLQLAAKPVISHTHAFGTSDFNLIHMGIENSNANALLSSENPAIAYDLQYAFQKELGQPDEVLVSLERQNKKLIMIAEQ